MFTDGPDTGSIAESGETAAAVSELAARTGTEVHFVQLDSRPEIAGGPSGPQDSLAQVACESGGSFQYVPRAAGLSDAMQALGRELPSHFEVDLEVPDFAGANIAPGAYRLGGRVEATVLGLSLSYSFGGDEASQVGISDVIDRRFTIFRRPVPDN